MKHDKKNASCGVINFTLLGGIGDIRINQTASQEEIYELLDFYREPWDKFCRVQTAFKRNLKILRNYCGKYLVIPNKAVPLHPQFGV